MKEKRSGWVIAAGVPGVAAADAPAALEDATNRPIFFNGTNRVIAAAWVKTADVAQKWAQKPLVKPDQPDNEPFDQIHGPDCLPSGFKKRCSARGTSFFSDSRRPPSESSWIFGLTTRSSPLPKPGRSRRKASRIRRLIRLRSTARRNIFFETPSPSR